MGGKSGDIHIEVEEVTMAYGDFVVMRELDFEVERAEVFVIMGGSGSGKSTLLKHMIGLLEPRQGRVLYNGQDFTHAAGRERERMLQKMGVLYQAGALWSSMTLAENVALPLEEFTGLSPADVSEIAHFKLALVGLDGFEDFYPSQISGGMRKRAGLARAMAMDPEILFFDEPSAGLDPVNQRRLDELILQLLDGTATTVVVVTHELPSIFAIADRCVFLDAELRRQTAVGPPRELLRHCDNIAVQQFLQRKARPEEVEDNRGPAPGDE